MIAIDDFQVLPFNKQCDFITVFADYLVYRIELDKKFYLYHMGDFFVEVCYVPYEGRVENINAFLDSDMLEPYLEQINIEVLSV
ncbi:hypothetical protein E1176_05610 [Fulvivirga sp. RKSG066]|uniref:hypothetical protein n=1 Tax=Fulvivirga aurantia TaxID=2529383 RepID=UPI0012BBABBE|nr:hypothetical protein [Fulvivirga aurantia]MTI20493.1 hypothetical protein [Fulvivirga aurantia]